MTYTTKTTYKTYLTYFLVVFAFAFFAPRASRAATLSKAPNNLGLVNYWPLNEGVGSKAGDFTSNGKTGTLTGGTWTNGKKGGALSFNGTSDKVTGGSITVGTNMTISAWIKKNTSTGQKSFFSNRSGGGTVYLGLSGTQVFLYDAPATPAPIYSGSGAVQIGQWQHIVATSNGSTTVFYVNGNQVNTASQTRTSSAGSFGIGWDPSIGTEYWDGLIDDVRVYNRALSGTDVYNLYKSGNVVRKMVSNQGLVGYWPLNEGVGNKAGDFSGNRFSATLAGTPLPAWSTGKRGGGLTFNGSTNYANLAGQAALEPTSITISAWAKYTNTNGIQMVMDSTHGVGDNKGWVMQIRGDTNPKRIDFGYGNNSTFPVASSTLNYGDTLWHHYTGTLTGTAMKFYVDGSLADSITYSGTPTPSNRTIEFGSWQSGSSRFLNGSLDDIRIYNRALSAAEVLALYKQNETNINHSQNSRLTNGLVGLWSFNGPDYNPASTTAEVLDRSGSGNNGNAINGPSLAIGKVGQGLQFDGVNDYITVSRNISDDFTLSAWVNKNASLTNNGACSSNFWYCGFGIIDAEVSGVFNDFGMSIKDNKLIFGTGNADVSILSTTTLSSNVWYHVVATRVKSTGALTIYINGVVENGGTGNTNSLTAPTTMYIGEDGDGNRGYFSGKLDEVRIYNRALSSDEVKQLYNMGR